MFGLQGNNSITVLEVMADESANGFDQDFGTRAIHAGQEPNQWPHGAVIPPICVSTTFAQPAPGEPLLGYDYSRAGNPTRTCLETCLASLEKAKYGEKLSFLEQF